MRVLLVDAYRPDDRGPSQADTVESVLVAGGHELRRFDIGVDGFRPYLSAEERRAYHDQGANISSDEVRRAAAAVGWAEGLVLCYPTTAFTVPAVLKAWFERVLLPGVAFDFDRNGKVVKGLTNIRRLGVVTSTPHGRWRTVRARDAGRRTVMWTIRLNCATTCRRTFVAVRPGDGAADLVRRRFRRW